MTKIKRNRSDISRISRLEEKNKVLEDVLDSMAAINRDITAKTLHNSSKPAHEQSASPLEMTCRAAAREIDRRLHAECAIAVREPYSDLDEYLFTGHQGLDKEWPNLAHVINRSDQELRIHPITDDDSEYVASIFFLKDFEEGKKRVHQEYVKLMAEQLAPMIEIALSQEASYLSSKLEKRFRRDIQLLSRSFDKISGINLLDHYISLAKESEKDLSLLFLDIDNFGDYNSTYGHQQGDECLKTVEQEVFEHIRHAPEELYSEGKTTAELVRYLWEDPRDFPFRYGGEEICVVLYDTNGEQALHIGDRLREGLKKIKVPQHKNNHNPYETYGSFNLMYNELTASIGLASLGTDKDRNAEDLIGEANIAEAHAKSNGRDGITQYERIV